MNDIESNDKINQVKSGLLHIAIQTINIPLLMVVSGYTTMCLWNWFLVPLIPSILPLTLVPAMGLKLLTKYLTFNHKFDNRGEDGKLPEITLQSLVVPYLFSGVLLLIGYFLKFGLQ